MAPFFLLLIAVLLTGCDAEPPRPALPAPPEGQALETAAFPVMLLSSSTYNPILCICKTPAQLRQSDDANFKSLQEGATLIDAAGTRFAVRRAQMTKGPRNPFVRYFTGTFYTGEPVKVNFLIQPQGPARTPEIWAAMERYHYNFRKCGFSGKEPTIELLRGFSNRNCVWPPL